MSTDDDLRRIAEAAPMVALLKTTRSPHEGDRGRSVPGPRLPLHDGQVALLDEVHATLGSWVRLVIDEGTLTDWPADHIPALCHWLRGHLGYLLAHPAADEFADEVGKCWRRMRYAIGEKPPRKVRCTGCHNPLDGHDVEGQVTEVMETWRWCSCPGCGMTFTLDAELRMLGRLQDLTVPQYADEAGVHERSLRRWVIRSGMPRTGQARGGPTYARDDLAALVARMRLAGESDPLLRA